MKSTMEYEARTQVYNFVYFFNPGMLNMQT